MTLGLSRDGARARTIWIWASLGMLLLFVAGRCLQPMDETDLFYNLRLGEIILGSRTVPRTNLLSFTNGDFPDPNLAWLFQIVLALAYRAGGIAATVVLKTAFVTATFALLFRVALRRGAHPVVAALALALAAWAAEPRFVERPHLVTFLGLAVVLLAVERAEAGQPRALFGLVPGGLVWANGNSCFFLAPVVLALYAIGCRQDGRRQDGRRAALVALVLVPVGFATPSGAGVVGYVVNHFRMPSLRPLQEYRAAEWPVDGPFFFLAGAVGVTALLAARAGRGWSIRHLLPILALGMLGVRRIRFVAEFALLAGPYLAAQATRLLALVLAPRLRRAAAALSFLVLSFLTWSPRLAAARAGKPFVDLSLEQGLVPLATIAWLDAHDLRDRLYNDLEVGSYLAWQGWPRHRVFQDPRINGYPPSWHAGLRRTDVTRDAWDAFLARYAVQAALVSFPDLNPRAALFDPTRWALVQRPADALVFVRRDDASRSLIAAEELPLTFRFDPASGTDAIPLAEAPPASPVPSCEWQRRLGDLFVERRELARADVALRQALAEPTDCLTPQNRVEARLQAAAVALEREDPERAALLLAGLETPQAHTNRGYALFKLGQAEEALGEFQAAVALEPDGAEARFGVGLTLVELGHAVEARAALDLFLDRWPTHFAAPRARQLRGDPRAR